MPKLVWKLLVAVSALLIAIAGWAARESIGDIKKNALTNERQEVILQQHEKSFERIFEGQKETNDKLDRMYRLMMRERNGYRREGP